MWLAAAAALSFAALALTVRVPEAFPDAAACSSGAHTLSQLGDRVYPEMGNGGYTSVHTDVYIVYDTPTNLFLPGTHVDLTDRATQCLTDFSLDFERTDDVERRRPGPNMTVSSITVNGQPATFTFVQPTYPGDPNGQNDPDPLAHAVSNANPVSATNPNPPACSPQVERQRARTGCSARRTSSWSRLRPDRRRRDDHRPVNYTGRPGVHTDGDGSTEGWFRVNTAAAPNDGSFVTTEPVGNDGLDAAQQPPEREADLRHLRHRARRQDGDRAGELVGATPGAPSPRSPDRGQPAGRELPGRLVDVALALPGADRELPRHEQRSARTTWWRARATISGIQYYQAQASAPHGRPEGDDQGRPGHAGGHHATSRRSSTARSRSRPTASSSALPNAGFEEEMQTKITFANGAARRRRRAGTFHHENMHQWFGDNVSEGAFNLTFWKEGWATVGEYLNTARNAARPRRAGWARRPATPPSTTSLVARFNTNYGTTSGTFWTSAPSNPTVGNLFTTASTYTRPGTAYLALRQILDGRQRGRHRTAGSAR